MRTLLPELLWALCVHGWTVLEDTLDRSGSIICKHLYPAHEAAEEIAKGVAGVIAGFETLDSREPAKRGVVSHGDSGRLGATSLKPISVAAGPAQSLNAKWAWNDATNSFRTAQTLVNLIATSFWLPSDPVRLAGRTAAAAP